MDVGFVIRSADAGDMDFLFDLRNNPQIRAQSFDSRELSYAGHKKWFASKQRDPACKIYIICLKDKNIGVLRFDKSDECVKVSIMMDPLFSGKGLGSKALRLGAAKFIEETGESRKLVAEIKRDNVSSIRAFQKAGFKESYLTYVLESEGRNE